MKSASFVRTAGSSLILAALLQLVFGIWQFLAPVWPPSLAFSLRNGAIALSHALVVVGVIGLARAGATGNGWLGKIGLAIALVGGTIFVPAELSIQVNETFGSNLDGMSAALLSLGLVLAGIAVIRARLWRGWHAFTPLVTGLYAFLVIIPSLATAKTPNFLALACWGLPTLFFGIAMRAEVNAERLTASTATSQPVAAR